MSIKNNAIDSISLGLEDYETSITQKDERRIISCTRNIYAGILLLFKHKISIIDEELLWVGNKRNNTVNYKNIRDLFEQRKIEVDWVRLDKINSYRNDAEHYFSTLQYKAVQGLISNSFLIIRDFIAEQLNEDPKEILGSDSWLTMVKIHEVYQREKDDCDSLTETLNFFSDDIFNAVISYSCEECGSDLIYPSKSGIEAVESDFLCKSCESSISYEEFIGTAVKDYHQISSYVAMTDGGDSPITECPFCGGVYLYEEKICAECGECAAHE